MKSPALLRTLSFLLMAGTVTSSLTLSGCGQSDNTAASSSNSSTPVTSATAPAWATAVAPALKGKSLRLAFVPKGMENSYWLSVKKGIDAAEADAGAAGIKVNIDWNGPPNEADRAAQISLVENYVAQQLDGICLCPMDIDALVAPAQKAHAAGIPLVIVDSPLNYDQTVTFVGTDNKKAGVLAAQEMAKELGDKGNVIMMRFIQGSASTGLREQGFLDEIKNHPDIKVLSSDVYVGDGGSDKAFTRGADLLNTYKGQVDGVFVPNQPTSDGMLRALETAGQAGKIKFIGFDGDKLTMDALNKGELNALVLQNPYEMGYQGVEAMLEHLAGQKVDANIDTGTVVVTKDNQSTDTVKTLLDHTVM
jgi:ribose transport system substrate-binding protein